MNHMTANTASNVQPIIRRKAVIGWLVDVDGESIRVELAELPAPGFPTIHQILHTARAKAAGLPADKVAFAMAIDAALEVALAHWEQSEAVRRHCVHLTNVDWRRAGKIENSYKDRDSVIGFDTAGQSAAYEIPDLGWNPSDDNGDALWEIVSRRPMPRPKRSDPAIRESAIAALSVRTTAAEVVPF